MSEAKKAPAKTATPAKSASTVPAVPKVKPYYKRMSDGKRGELRFSALAKKDGTAESYAIHIVRDADGKKDKATSKGRGASQKHTTFDAAKVAVDAGVAFALKTGNWTLIEKRKGRKDAFDLSTLPAPTK
jgi:hypothetical protein